MFLVPIENDCTENLASLAQRCFGGALIRQPEFDPQVNSEQNYQLFPALNQLYGF